ncbi:MAG: TIGR03943 family protein [Actinomycetota bacterium]|nr:TIGR03943 family protein [Actinomycetota bacterium]
MRRETQNVLLVLLGGALLKITWNGSYLHYVKPSLLPFLVSAGVVILALGLIAIVRDARAALNHTDHDDHPGHDDQQGHDHHTDHAGRSPWLLLLPVLAIFLVAPPALGADAVSRSASVAPQQSAVSFPPLPAGPVPALRMSDFVTRAVWDDAGSLNGRQVRLVGFVVHDDHGITYLGRLVMACCAADARPMKIRLDGRSGLASLPQDGWFEVRGQLVPGSARSDSGFAPTFTVSDLRPVPAPAEPYEF